MTTATQRTLLGSTFFNRPGNLFAAGKIALDTEMSATEALTTLGDYSIKAMALSPRNPKGVVVKSDYRTLWVTSPKTRDENGTQSWEMTGVVKGKYIPMQPADLAQAWENQIKLPLNAIGAAGDKGKTFILSSRLRDIQIGNDVVEMYLIGKSPMDGLGSITLEVFPVRQICTNGLKAMSSVAVMSTKIGHKAELLGELNAWLGFLGAEIENRRSLLLKEFSRMYNQKVDETFVTDYINNLFPLPKEPKGIGVERLVVSRVAEHRAAKALAEKKRLTTRELFETVQTGDDNLEMTAWRLYNKATAVQQWRNGDLESQTLGIIMGARGNEVEAASTLMHRMLREG